MEFKKSSQVPSRNALLVLYQVSRMSAFGPIARSGPFGSPEVPSPWSQRLSIAQGTAVTSVFGMLGR